MKIKIACAQIEIIAGNPQLNTQTALKAIAEAKQQNIDVLLLPELGIPGYLLGDLWEQPAFLQDCATFGEKIIAASQEICIVFGNIATDPAKVNEDGRIRKYNAAFTVQNGKIIHGPLPYPFIIKTSLPDYREFDDSRYFHSLVKLQPELVPYKTVEELLQPLKIIIKGEEIRLGVMICEDGWTENYHFNVPKILQKNGAQILCNISCSPFTLNKNHKRDKVFSAQVKNCGIPLLYCNNIGIQNNGKNVFTYDGCSCIYAPDGHLVANSKRFEPDLLICEFDTITGKVASKSKPQATMSETEEIYAALYYGAKNFLAQMHITKMTIGISGGIDSAVTAAFYINILGPENVLLVNMPSRYNSQITKNLAETMAKSLGTNYTIMPIQSSVDQTIEQITTTPIYNFSQSNDFYLKLTSLAKENIQARDRGARIIAGLSSAWGGAFSCNSNKTELTVGYATFYGDIAGCLAIIGDLWKHQVYALGRYLNDIIYKRQVIAEDVFTITPSAELSSAQTVGTGGDPLLYPYHDYLFKAFVEKWHKISPEEILSWYLEGTLENNLGCQPGLTNKFFKTPAAFVDDLEHWWKLFCGFAVAKRIQAPPILSITKRSYGYDHREAQLIPYFSQKYLELKKTLLK